MLLSCLWRRLLICYGSMLVSALVSALSFVKVEHRMRPYESPYTDTMRCTAVDRCTATVAAWEHCCVDHRNVQRTVSCKYAEAAV
jgi:hypothetical protein